MDVYLIVATNENIIKKIFIKLITEMYTNILSGNIYLIILYVAFMRYN